MIEPQPLRDLIERSRALGADRRVTNYGGGNTSAKGTVIDPASGEEIEVVWVKGSGGDLRTLTVDGVACLRRDRYQSLRRVYRGPEHEDEMVALADYCLHGRRGAAPSIDTAMHVLVDAAHVDHLHPDAGLAIATAEDGERLTQEIFGGRVLWVPWRRPGFQLGLDIADAQREHPEAIGAILGGHGTTAWADSSEECRENSLWIIRTARAYIEEHGRPEPLGAIDPARLPSPASERRQRALLLAPHLRALASQDEPVLSHFSDDDVVLDFLSRTRSAELAVRGSCCPDHYLRTKVLPMLLPVDAGTAIDDILSIARVEHARYRREYEAYYRRNADAGSPRMRGADPRIILLPGLGMFSFGRDATTARVAGEYFVSSIVAMEGAESLSSYRPVPEGEKFRIEYWALEEAKLARAPEPRSLATRVVVMPDAAGLAGSHIAQLLSEEGASLVAGRSSSSSPRGAGAVVEDGAQGLAALVATATLSFGGVDAIVADIGFESEAAALLHSTAATSQAPALVLLDPARDDVSIRVEHGLRRALIPAGIADASTTAELVHAVLGGALRRLEHAVVSGEEGRG